MLVEYKILRFNFMDSMNGKTRFRKMDPKGVLIAKEEIVACHYIEEMADLDFFLLLSK